MELLPADIKLTVINADWRLTMVYESFKGERYENRLRMRRLLNTDPIEGSEKPNAKREQFIAFLKKRYGYTNEKAVDEFERLLKQFYKLDRSSGIPRVFSNFKHSHAE
jgi:hypothetical protein